jgi:hypothetical protein
VLELLQWEIKLSSRSVDWTRHLRRFQMNCTMKPAFGIFEWTGGMGIIAARHVQNLQSLQPVWLDKIRDCKAMW